MHSEEEGRWSMNTPIRTLVAVGIVKCCDGGDRFLARLRGK